MIKEKRKPKAQLSHLLIEILMLNGVSEFLDLSFEIFLKRNLKRM
jgi:hypothetical protein